MRRDVNLTLSPTLAAVRLANPFIDEPFASPERCQALVPGFLFSAITQCASTPSGPSNVAGPAGAALVCASALALVVPVGALLTTVVVGAA